MNAEQDDQTDDCHPRGLSKEEIIRSIDMKFELSVELDSTKDGHGGTVRQFRKEWGGKAPFGTGQSIA